jgi:chromosomal replication initiation ATPase DnaA
MGSDDFMITDSNREAVGWIDRWPAWPSHCLIVYGPAGAGKTHLAHVWQAKSRGKLMSIDEIAVGDAGALVVSNRQIAIDNADRVSGDADRERNLLHLYNILREAKGYLLLTAIVPPAQWNIELPDLRSRLLASPATALAAPDEALLSALMIKQFGDRQLDVKTDVIEYILPRLVRTPEALRDLVAALDRASLAENRRITVMLARRVLEEGG